MSRKQSSALTFFLAFAALLAAVHLPYLSLPFHWDELGQFVPAALDLYRDGAWVAHSTLPNVHPPGVMALVALAWRIFGYSIPATRLAMLAVGSLGVLFSFLLAIRLARGTVGAPAFAAVLFLLATPLFYTQSMMVLLDAPAMTFTILALLLFLEARARMARAAGAEGSPDPSGSSGVQARWMLCAAACTVAVLVKETALTTPAVFAAWLWFRERRRREALYFAAPAMALGLWLVVLHHATGHWLGNEAFARYNVAEALRPQHILLSIAERAWFLFAANGRFIGTLALFVGWRLLRGVEWSIAGLVAGAQVLAVTLLGGAALDRYLLPALPILYAAMATAASAYPASWRKASDTAMIGLLLAGWFWNSPFPLPYEDNLAMVDFVHLHQDAAEYLEVYMPHRRIASAWPFTDEISRPEFGYVEHPLHAVKAEGLRLAQLAGLDRHDYDVLVVFSGQRPLAGTPLDIGPLHELLRRDPDYHPQASEEEIRAGLGFVPRMRFERGGQWVEIYVPGQ